MNIANVGHSAAPARSAAAAPPGGRLKTALCSAVLCVALGLGATSLPAFAEVRVVIRAAPPPMQVEEVPTARHGYLWAPGFWRWQNRQHVWTKGHWERERRGQRYEPARWEQHDNRYRFAPGRWQPESNRGHRRQRIQR